MIELQKTFVSGVGGFSGPEVLTYTLVKREGMFAVYERSKNGKVKDYEAIEIKLIPKGTTIFGSEPSLDDEERYPSNNDFSKTAFSYHGRFAKEAALEKMQKMILEQNQESVPKKQEFIIPPGEFTTNQFAEANKTNYVTAFNWIKENLGAKIKFLYEKNLNAGGRGKPSKFYGKAN